MKTEVDFKYSEMSNRKRRSLETISNSTDPNEFFIKHVATRIPVIIDGHLKDAQWKGTKLWTNNDYLKSKAGDKIVQVEEKTNTDLSFGKGSVKQIAFSRFLTDLDSHISSNSSMYLSTQELHYCEDGKPDLVSEPVTSLISDIPTKPLLMGNLVPQNVNLWMGASTEATSSGLHHDYHDNLYILLRGKKKFLLIPPACAFDMYTVGVIDRIHPNGRINYVNRLPTMADGSTLTSHIAVKASTSIDEAAARLDQILQAKERQELVVDDDSSDICDAEKAIDQAMEDLLDAEMAFDNNDDSDEDDDFDNDDEEDENGDDCDIDDADEVTGDEKLECILTATATELALQRAKAKETSSSSTGKRHPNNTTRSSSTIEPVKKKAKATASTAATAIPYPDNFSQVRETEQSVEHIRTHFPNYYAAKENHGITVELRAGQMLYLPAGWFHEVFSVGDLDAEEPTSAATATASSNTQSSNKTKVNKNKAKSNNDSSSNSSSSSGGGGSSIHMALNYWFHPPDGDSFDKPYSSNFWPDDWKNRNFKLV